jgi:hypothetical protein
LSSPQLWQGKGEEHFLPGQWYDGLERESYGGLEGEPRTSGRRRSTMVEPKGQVEDFFSVIAGRDVRATREDELRAKECGGGSVADGRECRNNRS